MSTTFDFEAQSVGSLPPGFVNVGTATYGVVAAQAASGSHALAVSSNTDDQVVLFGTTLAGGNGVVEWSEIVLQLDSANMSHNGFVLRSTADGATFYLLLIDESANGGAAYSLTPYLRAGGSYTPIGSQHAAVGPSTTYGLRVRRKAQVNGNVLSYKEWPASGTEPDWQVTITDGTIPATGGPYTVGARYTHTGTTGIAALDDVVITDLATAPTTPDAATLAGPSPASGPAAAESAAWTITLNRAAPTGGTVVALASSEPGDVFHATAGGANVTAITIPAGQTVGSFLLRTDATTGPRTVTPTAAGIAFTPSTFSYTATVPATIVYTQNFDALPTGPLADFALSGGADFTVGTIDPVSGAQSFGTATPASMMAAVATHVGAAAVNLVAEIEVYYEHIPHSPGGSGSAVFTPIVRADAGFTAGYWWAGNPVGALLYKRVGGVDAQRGGFVAFAAGNLLPDVAYNVRARAETQSAAASRLRLKVWPHGQAEPSVWDYDFLDDTDPIDAAGYGGALVYDTSANVAPLAFDSVTVYDLTGAGGLPPASPLTPGGAPSQTGEIALVAVAPSGGSGSYTYQWHAATTDGFTPTAGNAVPGGTAPTLVVDQPLVTTYYVLVASDGTSQVPYPQVAVSGASSGSNAVRGGVVAMNGGFQ